MARTPLEVRNLRFDQETGIPRHWHGERRAVTTFFDNLSIFFPAGERFFIASVRAHRRHVHDAALAEDVRGFCMQEGIHNREHAGYNERLAREGWPIAAMEGRVERLLARVSKIVPKRMQLGATCALEHFTALMGHFLLAEPEHLDGAHPTMAALWRWHAAEENEHKHVAFDVFRASGGTYAERVATMVAASVIFWAKVLEHQARMMAVDGIALDAREWVDLAKFLFVSPGGMRRLIPLYFAYYRPGFHPNDLDDEALLEAFRREVESSPLYRRAA